MNQATNESASAEATGGQIAAAVMAYIQAGKRGLDLYGAMQCAIEAAMCRTPSVTRGDYAELRRLAVAATPGPWEASRCSIYNADRSMMIYDEGGHSEADAAFIATFNPAKVLAMIDRLEELEGRK